MPNDSGVPDRHKPGCVDLINAITNMEAIDFSSVDQIPAYVTTAILVTTAGTLKVDMLGLGTGITIALAVGWHHLRITKVYHTGSATLVGWLAS